MSVPSIPLIEIRPTVSNETIQFFWKPPQSDGGSPILQYVLSDGINTYYPNSSPTYIVNGLTNGQNYTFTLAAENAIGIGPSATFRTVQPGNPPPYYPFYYSTSFLSTTAAKIEWVPSGVNGEADIKWYTIIAKPNNTIYPIIEKGALGNQSEKWINGLNQATSYTFEVYAVNDPGYSPTRISGNFKNGLITKLYNGFFNDDVNWFSNRKPLYNTSNITNMESLITSTDNLVSNLESDNFSIEWIGYFYCRDSGLHTFTTTSDDGSFLWLGTKALSGYTTENALVNNGGVHGTQSVSGQVQLVAGTYYPIRIQFGEQEGGEVMSVTFSSPTQENTSDFTNYFFY